MNWLTITWCVAAAACMTLALLYFVVWFKDRHNRVHLLFAIAALGVAGIAASELAIMLSQTPHEFGERVRWAHVPIFIAVVSIVWFVYFYFQAGRLWLAWLVCGVRALALILNFAFSPNLNFVEVTGVRQVPVFGGATVSLPEGVVSQRTRIGELASLLLLIFVLDASVTLWRRRGPQNRQRAVRVGGSIVVFVLVAAGHVSLIHAGAIRFPYMISFAFLFPIVAMGYELVADVVRGARLARELGETQDQLRHSQQQMELAEIAASIGLWRWDVDRDDMWVSDRARTLLNLNGDGRLDWNRFALALVPEHRDSLRAAVLESLGKGMNHDGEYCAHRVNGDTRWIAIRGCAELNGGTQRRVIRGVVFDVTDRRQADERFRTAVEASPHALLVVNLEGKITLVNAQTEAVFGYKRQELLGQSIAMLIPDRSHLNRSDGDGMAAVQEGVGLRKDGREFPVELRLNPMRTSEGDFTISTIIDLTDRKNAERERARQRSELFHLSRVAMLGELSGSLAHELNQPLTAILSNAQAAQEFLERNDTDLSEVKGILRDIVNEDRRAGEVIRRLRLLFRKGETQREELNLNELVLEVLKLINSELINHGVSVGTMLASNLPQLNADRVQLQQVLINLLVNASDAMAETQLEDRRLRVSTWFDEHDGIRLSIADCGCGIPHDQLDQVFEPFHTTKTSGMGLGLPVCRTIVSAHGGRIWATNNSDRGASFHMSFPQEEGHEQS